MRTLALTATAIGVALVVLSLGAPPDDAGPLRFVGCLLILATLRAGFFALRVWVFGRFLGAGLRASRRRRY